MDAGRPPVPEEPPTRDWSLLPLDVLASVFVRVGAVDVLMGAGLVCRSWLEAAKLPDVWRVVDMEDYMLNEDVRLAMSKAAVDRSDGQLQTFAGELVTDELMQYIVDRSPSLATLRLVSCYDVFSDRFASVIKVSPMLELRSLELDDIQLSVQKLTAVLENCPVLEVLRVHCFVIYDEDEHALRAKFARIKTMTLHCDDEFRCDSRSNFDYYDI